MNIRHGSWSHLGSAYHIRGLTELFPSPPAVNVTGFVVLDLVIRRSIYHLMLLPHSVLTLIRDSKKVSDPRRLTQEARVRTSAVMCLTSFSNAANMDWLSLKSKSSSVLKMDIREFEFYVAGQR